MELEVMEVLEVVEVMEVLNVIVAWLDVAGSVISPLTSHYQRQHGSVPAAGQGLSGVWWSDQFGDYISVYFQINHNCHLSTTSAMLRIKKQRDAQYSCIPLVFYYQPRVTSVYLLFSFLQISKIWIFLNFPISKFPSLEANTFSTPSPVSQEAGCFKPQLTNRILSWRASGRNWVKSQLSRDFLLTDWCCHYESYKVQSSPPSSRQLF